MSKNIVFEGWLTKSPPSKRIWRTKWRRRWFALRQSGELPGQYFLDYYADRNCRRLKGTINLDFCEQVDAGLHMERGSHSHGSLDPKLRGSVFTIQTQTRTYHLEADCEADMERWVDAICRVCGLRATEDTSANPSGIYQNHSVTVGNQENIALRVVNENKQRKAANNRSVNNMQYNTVSGRSDQHQPLVSNSSTMANEQYQGAESTGPYIPISECITGVRAQDVQNAFTFDSKNIVITITAKAPFEKTDNKRRIYLSQPQIRINNVELSENDSNFSEDECRSLNASQSNIGPPVPPRPPKTFAMSKDFSQKELLQANKVMEPIDFPENNPQRLRTLRRSSHTPPSPSRSGMGHSVPRTDDEDEAFAGHSIQYCNLISLPPAVDRALKPRHSSHTIGTVSNFYGPVAKREETKSDRLQYLDLDLQPSSKPSTSNSQDLRRPSIVHGKSLSSDADSAYKTVDFLKTEAFNITRQDAEASRSNQQ
ncbi:GRB2-associated-binding protein 1 isoform X2 [Maniola jurtina]|uniref:GRB2-associated-binding protein 1 isoform X2 n=1 Tax=Maniola jurtina TaxID=191418 RepID=UPI001E68856A|nr:GRB2-associated-binding protein 1 isoform X2 [Maniola jurtina]